MLVAAVSIWAIVSASGGGEASSSSSSSSSSGTSVSSGSSEVEVFTVPSFVGKKYTDLASNQAYTKYVSFLTEHEFSNDYKAGEVMRQSHPQGTQVAVGTVITLTVSDGPETAVMPEVLGRPQADVEADLKALKIKYALYPLVNDGSYVAGTVARSDTDKGTVVEIGKTTVTLYIAGEAPKQPDSSGVGTALAGVGVAFKLVCAMDGDADKMLARYGDLVAVGHFAQQSFERNFRRSGFRRRK